MNNLIFKEEYFEFINLLTPEQSKEIYFLVVNYYFDPNFSIDDYFGEIDDSLISIFMLVKYVIEKDI